VTWLLSRVFLVTYTLNDWAADLLLWWAHRQPFSYNERVILERDLKKRFSGEGG
jgi:hypothetical protein